MFSISYHKCLMEENIDKYNLIAGGHGVLVPKVPEDRKIVDNLVNEIRKGKVLRRLSMRHKSYETKK